jgi:hypothetical protein
VCILRSFAAYGSKQIGPLAAYRVPDGPYLSHAAAMTGLKQLIGGFLVDAAIGRAYAVERFAVIEPIIDGFEVRCICHQRTPRKASAAASHKILNEAGKNRRK